MFGHTLRAVQRFLVTYLCLILFSLVGIVVTVWMAWPPHSSSYTPRSRQRPNLSPFGLICHAHSSIARLQPSSPDTPTTLLSVLRLDLMGLPFHLANYFAYPYSSNCQDAKMKVTEAWAEVTDKHHRQMREWRDAFALAAMVLLNDTSRTVYMKEVLPMLQTHDRGDPERARRSLCEKKGSK